MLYIKVPYEEKDEAKRLGAKWDAQHKCWYVQDRRDYWKFVRWLHRDAICCYVFMDHFWLVEGVRRCWRKNCGQETAVVAIANGPLVEFDRKCYATQQYLDQSGEKKGYDGTPFYEMAVDAHDYADPYEILLPSQMGREQLRRAQEMRISDRPQIGSMFEPLPEDFAKWLEHEYSFKPGYSRTVRESYRANHCSHCGALQGDNFLFQEIGSPFAVTNEEKARALNFRKVRLSCDLVVEWLPMQSSGDVLLRDLPRQGPEGEPFNAHELAGQICKQREAGATFIQF